MTITPAAEHARARTPRGTPVVPASPVVVTDPPAPATMTGTGPSVQTGPRAAHVAGTDRLTVTLTGMIAGTPHLGGLTWVALNQLFGLIAAGTDAHLVEPVTSAQLTPPGTSLADSDNAAYLTAVTDRYRLAGHVTLLCTDTRETIGLPYRALVERAQRSDVVINVGGVLGDPDLTEPAPVRAYLDIDPGFTQLWAEQGADMRLDGHTHFVTVGPLLGTPACPVPTLDRHWIAMLPPVSLAHWHDTGPVAPGAAFTTVASWRGYGSVWHDGVHYGQKAHAMRPLFPLTGLTAQRLQLALEIHPDETSDVDALATHDWDIVDPAVVAATPEDFHAYVTGSKGELGIAKLGYIAGRTGWLSDRSACYLAAGRPVAAHDTGAGAVLPTGEGLVTFRTVTEAADALDEIAGNYDTHRHAARELAVEHFDARTVMARLLDDLTVTPPPAQPQ